MANSVNNLTTGAFTRQLARIFLERFDSERVLSKNVDTQLLQGRFNPASGDTVDFKRPTDYVSVRTISGDVFSETPNNIVTARASGIVQNYFTAFLDYDEADEAIKLDQLDQLLAPLATRIKTDLELDFANFMMTNTALLSGTVGTAITGWADVALAGSIMQASGVPMDSEWMYGVNPFTQRILSDDQRSLGAGGQAGTFITDAQKRATLTENFAGMKVLTATTLASYTTASAADRVGTLASLPDETYITNKDTMTQTLAVSGLTGDRTVFAGETIEITAASGATNRLNLSTRQAIVDDTGAAIVWTATVTADAAISGGTGTLIVTGPAINETDGQYNTVSQRIESGDIITILGSADVTIQPNLFWHRKAFSIGSVPIKKLSATDTIATTSDGLQFRVTHDSDFLRNKNMVRFDFRPAYSVLNPFFAGQSFGV